MSNFGQYLGKITEKLPILTVVRLHLIEAVADTQGGYYRRDVNIHFIHSSNDTCGQKFSKIACISP